MIKNQKGITVIALLITVIVLVMIALVSAFYSTNAINHAENARNTYQISQEDENNKVENFGLTIDDKYNTKYTSASGTEYRRFEVWTSNRSPGTRYRNCTNMETIECPNFTLSNPYNTTDSMFAGCENLKSIKIPLAQTAGHYVFSNLPALEYLELGSIGHPFGGGRIFYEMGSSSRLSWKKFWITCRTNNCSLYE